MQEPSPSQEPVDLGRHRWRAMWNGIVIGIGLGYIIPTPPAVGIGIVFIGVGVGVEYWQRKRLKRQG